MNPPNKTSYIPDKKPQRPPFRKPTFQPRNDPNVVARQFLAALINQRIFISAPGEPHLSGILKRFDDYSLLLGDEAGGHDMLIFKGPGMKIGPSIPL
jgi:hypothetical protein